MAHNRFLCEYAGARPGFCHVIYMQEAAPGFVVSVTRARLCAFHTEACARQGQGKDTARSQPLMIRDCAQGWLCQKGTFHFLRGSGMSPVFCACERGVRYCDETSATKGLMSA